MRARTCFSHRESENVLLLTKQFIRSASKMGAGHRFGPAVLHLLQWSLFAAGAVATFPLWLAIFGVAITPLLALGLGSQDEAIGLPLHWRCWRRTIPHVLLMVVFVDIPLLLLVILYVYVGFCFLIPVARIIFEMHRAVTCAMTVDSNESGTELASAPKYAETSNARAADIEAGAAYCEARYRQHASIWAALEGDGEHVKPGDVRLLSLAWLMTLADRGGVLPRRQNLPNEAFIDAAHLRQIEAGARRGWDQKGFAAHLQSIGSGGGLSSLIALVAGVFRFKRNVDDLLPIVAISYCWLEAAHPDREGKQLRLLCDRLKNLYGGRGLLGACRDYGFADMGVFIDWGSGYQKDPTLWPVWMSVDEIRTMSESLSDEELKKAAVDGVQMVSERRAYEGSRPKDQKDAFDRMLTRTMDLWYAHAAVTVVLLTQLPDELPAGFDKSRTYASRGWTTFERCSSELAKNFDLKVAKWKLVIDISDKSGVKSGGALRRLPTTPERMVDLLADCRFTNGADKQAVIKLYEKTARNVLGALVELDYMGSIFVNDDPWSSPARLAEALNYCVSLKRLKLHGSRLDDEGATQLAAGLNDGALPALEIVQLSSCRFSARGIREIFSVFRRGIAPNLSALLIAFNPFGDAGVAAIATALASGCMPPRLAVLLAGVDMGDDGAKALATALPSAGPGCDVICAFNRIGFAGQSALLRAVEAKHGLSVRHHLSVAFNGVLWPAALSRAMARGARRTNESGQEVAF